MAALLALVLHRTREKHANEDVSGTGILARGLAGTRAMSSSQKARSPHRAASEPQDLEVAVAGSFHAPLQTRLML
jgi:hypothetical protein